MIKITTFVFSIFLIFGCQSQPTLGTPIPLTIATVEKNIVRGKTTQQELISLFGSPKTKRQNTIGQEVWSYTKKSTDKKSKDQGAGAILGGLVDGVSPSTVKATSTSHLDLTITFDKKGTVLDHSVITTKF